ncbi:MAG: transporter [Firmicutes bacterium]|nr:transporter [Bacillota bacterium]
MEQPHLWSKNFIIVFLSNLASFLAFHMLVPILPVYIINIGGGDVAVGLVSTAFSVSAILIRFIVGKSLDTIGRKAVLYAGLFITMAAIIGYPLVSIVTMVICIRFIHGFGWGMTSTAFNTIASDIIPKTRLAEGLGFFGMTVSLAMALAPSVAFYFYYQSGFLQVIVIATLLCLLSMILPFYLKLGKTNQIKLLAGNIFKWENIIDKDGISPSLLIVLVALTQGGVINFVALFGVQNGISNVGSFFFCNAMMALFVRSFAGRLQDQKGPTIIIIPSYISMMAGVLLLSFSTNQFLLIGSGLLYGLGQGAVTPAIQTLLISRTSTERRGVAIAMYMSAIDIGMACGGLVLGYVASLTNYIFMYRISAIFPALGIVLFSYFWLKQKNKQRMIGS